MIKFNRMLFLLMVLVCIQSSLCGPQTPEQEPNAIQPKSQGPENVIPIIRQFESIQGDGNFNFSYETGNGIRVQQGGYIKQLQHPQTHSAALNANEADIDEGGSSVQVITGSYSYKTPDGMEINLTYIADENGFQPQGSHLPTPPPIPPAILRALNLIPKTEVRSGATEEEDHQQEGASNTVENFQRPSDY